MDLPSKILQTAVDEISTLPGIGKNTAIRLCLHMLQRPSFLTENLGIALHRLVSETIYCKNCFQISDQEICSICLSPKRNKHQICVVEQITDLLAIEKTGVYKGVFHVLGGKIDPMEGIGPEKLKINELLTSIEKLGKTKPIEIIFAFSSTFEGDTTMFYLHKKLKQFPATFYNLARGVGIGDELHYTNSLTLAKSLENKVVYDETT